MASAVGVCARLGAGVCARGRGRGAADRDAGAGEPPVWGRRGGTRPALALPAVAEAAKLLLSRVTPESWVARTPERRRCQLICQTIFLPIRNN